MSNKSYKMPLNEVTRWEMIRRSQRESPLRFQKKNFYRAKDFSNVNFETLFSDDTFVWESRVGDYIVTISFEGAFEQLKFEYGLERWKGANRWKRINLSMLSKSLSRALDTEDLRVRCTCADFRYRFAYHLTQEDAIYGQEENRPNRFKWTNKDNNNGFVCKHILSVLYGKRWIPAASKSWLSYIKANPEVASYYIWGE